MSVNRNANVSVKAVLNGAAINAVIVPAVEGYAMPNDTAVKLRANPKACAWMKHDGEYYATPPKVETKAEPKPKAKAERKPRNKSGLTVKVDWRSDADAVIKHLRDVNLPKGSRAEVVGTWVWLYSGTGREFSKELHDMVTSVGFRFNPNRGCYQHRGGGKKTGTARKYNPKERYTVRVAVEA